MEIVKITQTGVTFEITNRIHGMLEQGGVRGRQVLIKWETLKRDGIRETSDIDKLEAQLNEEINDYGTTRMQSITRDVCEFGSYDKLVAKGEVIR